MVERHLKTLFSVFTLLFVLVACEKNKKDDVPPVVVPIRYPDTLLAYMPAPNQFANEIPCLYTTAEGIIGKKGLVSLGGWGGYIIVGFDKAIVNKTDTGLDTDSIYGVDFTVIGNAYSGSSEPGIVYVMQDVNGNGKADDVWYELKGDLYDNDSTIHNYSLTYYNINDTLVTWKDNQGNSDTLLQNGYHTQSFYPNNDAYPQDSIIFKGSLLPSNMKKSGENTWAMHSCGFGYADNFAIKHGVDLNMPDNPATPEVEGCGGDPFMIEWAVDEDGKSVQLDSIHFVKIQSAVFDSNLQTGDVSCEVAAIVVTKDL